MGSYVRLRYPGCSSNIVSEHFLLSPLLDNCGSYAYQVTCLSLIPICYFVFRFGFLMSEMVQIVSSSSD